VHPDPPQRDAGRLRPPEQIVGHAPPNGQVQQLATVQAKPAAASASGTVDDDGVRPGRTDRRRLVVRASRLDLEWHRERSCVEETGVYFVPVTQTAWFSRRTRPSAVV
jgi:hypothetical protein